MDDASEWICKRVVLKSVRAAEATKPAKTVAPAQTEKPVGEAEVHEPESHASGVGQTFIYRGADFEGTLRLRESIRLDCEFRGEVVSEGRVLVAETARLQANVRADEVVIAGVVVGDIEAEGQVIIRAGGRVDGDIETPCLEVEKGAFFNGRMSMVGPKTEPHAAPSASVHTELRDDSRLPDPSVPLHSQ